MCLCGLSFIFGILIGSQSKKLPLVSLTSSSSTSSSCTQLVETSSSNSTETGDDLTNTRNVLALPSPMPISNEMTDETNVYICPELDNSKIEEEQYYANASDTITEQLLAIKCVGSKNHNNSDGTSGHTSTSNNWVPTSSASKTNSSPTKYVENGQQNNNDATKPPHKSSIIDYKNEARNLEKTRHNWSDSNVRKTSKQNERRQSISSEESLSDYEELGGNHTTINGDIGSHRNSR